ncbi:DUF3826 domain-containing protein [Dysgonomonas macrotermitis]|uniref:DUF3826 domain-containing protein n=1 Tax=Dysgonomonas macrotermitis TaxID=1346286 RepID=A0A1M4W0I6_9BACT|nr:DUF3826 domain-containing protein [Dysgonomonas macrotermitis]SHE74655.1 Protein of unknown function [Dysgonomonas macrotermitis]
MKRKFTYILLLFAFSVFVTNAQAQEVDDIQKKATLWVTSLNLNDSEKELRLIKVISTHLQTVNDWHNSHLDVIIPDGINPKTGEKISQLDKQIIVDSTLPKEVHETLMSGLRADLTEEQVEAILDKYTIGKVAFTMKAYKEIVPDMTPEEEAFILSNLKQAREQAIDYKSMKQISAIFEIYKNKIELYLYQNGHNWKAIYKEYVNALKKKKMSK